MVPKERTVEEAMTKKAILVPDMEQSLLKSLDQAWVSSKYSYHSSIENDTHLCIVIAPIIATPNVSMTPIIHPPR